MKIYKITTSDVNNGPGFRTSVWIQGCPIRCPSCHNKSLWDETDDVPDFSEAVLDKILSAVQTTTCSGLSILGGEPIKIGNETDLLELAKICKTVKNIENKTVWLYTGYTYEHLIKDDVIKTLIFPYVDVLVDGPYIKAQRDTSLAYRGSTNQRLIACKSSLINNNLTLYNN